MARLREKLGLKIKKKLWEQLSFILKYAERQL